MPRCLFNRLAMVLVAASAAGLRAETAAPRPPGLEDLLALKTIGTAAVAPDGRLVAYGVREADFAQDAFVTRLWLARSEGASHPLTAPGKNVGGFRWSPDGRYLAFLSGREGGDKDQIFVISPSGGEAIRLTKAETSISDFAWSRDGQKIVFVAEEPETPASKRRKERLGDFTVVRREYAHAQLFTLDLAEALRGPVAGRQRTRGRERSVQDPAFSPDGSRIAFSATTTPDLVQTTTADLYVLSLADDSVRAVVSQPGPDSHPVWSPDGRRLAFATQMGRTRFYATNTQIAVVEAEGGIPRVLTGAFDEDAELVDWTEEGLYFSAFQRTAYHLFRIDPDTGGVRRVSQPDGLLATGFSVSPDGRHVAFTAGAGDRLVEVFLTATADFAPHRLTDQSQALAGLELGTRELVTWKSRDGAPIEGVLIKPARFDPGKRHPLLCIIHGGPTGIDRPMVSDLRYYPADLWAARGAVILKVNYRGSAGYGERFRTLNYGNLGVGDAWDVLSGIDHLVAQGFVDPARLGCMGWSQGGYISAFLTTSSDRFRAISVGAGISNWATYYYNTDITPFTVQYLGKDPAADPEIYRKTSPMTYVMKARTPTLIQHGENDRRVPIPNAYELRQGLEDRGVPVEMVVYKGFGHGISKPLAMRAVMQHNLSWFGHYIFGDPAPDLTAPPGGAEAVPSPPKPIDRDAIRKTQAAATAAREKKDWATLVAESRKLVSLAPESTRARYSLACALSRNGETLEAIRVLGRLADQGVQFDLAKDEDLAPLAGAPEFREVAARMQALDTPIGTSMPAFRLPEKDLLAEAVAHDPKTGRFFVSSVHRRKIVLRDPDGDTRDFVPEGTEGLLSAMALALDPKRRALYVSTQGQSLTRGLREEERGRAAVLEFDLDSAQLRRRLVPPVAGGSVGDLALDGGGTVYVADPEAGRIYSAPPTASGLDVLVDAGPITSTQGLTVAADGQHLYAADYLRGIARVHLASGRVELLQAPDRLALTGIDGLVLAGDSLVAIQNGLNPHRVLRLRLDPSGTSVVSGEVLERLNPHFDEPTLGVRVENDFYYVANSQYEAFDREGRPDPARLREPVILRMRLPWLEGGP